MQQLSFDFSEFFSDWALEFDLRILKDYAKVRACKKG